MDANLGVGFSYEEVFEMCQAGQDRPGCAVEIFPSLLISFQHLPASLLQEVAKLEGEIRSRSAMSKLSTVSMDSNHHHVIDMEESGGVDLDAMRKRLRFRATVSLVSRNTVSMSELSEDEGRMLRDRTRLSEPLIVGGNGLIAPKHLCSIIVNELENPLY